MLLARARVVRPPFVYVAIGLPERLARLRSARMERLYARALGSAAAIVAYSRHEADVIEGWLRERGVDARVEFVPFGVDVDAFRPAAAAPDVDVVSVGADPHRDFELLLDGRAVAARRELPRGHDGRARTLARRPRRPTSRSRPTCRSTRCARRLERARVVALPVRENSYSGATTVLLQAMALGKPVVVTRTAAIATGYGLEDGENVRLVAPGDGASFGRVLVEVLGDDESRTSARRAAHARPSSGRSRGSGTSGGSKRSSERAPGPAPDRQQDRRLSSPSCVVRSAGVGVLALGLGLALVLLQRRPVRCGRPGGVPQRRGENARRRPALRGGLRQQGSALLLHVRRRPLGRRMARPVPARRDLGRARRRLRRAAGSSDRGADARQWSRASSSTPSP